MKKLIYIVLFLLFGINVSYGQFISKLRVTHSTTLKELCEDNKKTLAEFFKILDLDHKGLEKVKTAVNQKDYFLASQELIEYYHQKSKTDVNRSIKKSTKDSKNIRVSEDIMNGTFEFQDVVGTIDFKDKNCWSNLGPNNDMEWGYFLNRFSNYTQNLIGAYFQTDDEKYSKFFNFMIVDWIIKNPTPTEESRTSVWRVLESGIRMNTWINGFYSLQESPEFTDISKMLMLISIYEHGGYLREFHTVHHNHGVTELTALLKLAYSFEEFKFSKEWIPYTETKMDDEFNYQVLPDGAQRELSSSYHWVVVNSFREYIDLHIIHKRNLSTPFLSKIEQMLNYSAYSSRPDGFSPLNNDCDLYDNHAKLKANMSPIVRPDWNYIISKGKEGVKPALTSIMFPWAGQLIMRNSWGEDLSKAQWAFFDAGPWGANHQHNDKLHLSVFSNGREILCDNGRLYYKPDDQRLYVNLSVSHNVILVDGKGQNECEKVLTRPLIPNKDYKITPTVDFCISSYTDNFGDSWNKTIPFQYHPADKIIPGSHTRAVVYIKNKFWVVFDQIQSDKAREIKPLWHFMPDCNVIKDGESIMTNDSALGNLLIQPMGRMEWNIDLVKGQRKPYIQGWHSKEYNDFEPAYCAEYKTQMRSGKETIAWLLTPFTGTAKPNIKTKVLSRTGDNMIVSIEMDGEKPIEIGINFNELMEIKLSDNSTFTGRCIVKGLQPEDFKMDEVVN